MKAVIGMSSPLSLAVFGVSDIDEATSFYRDVIGFDATDEVVWSGSEFEALWHLPKGSTARARLFSHGHSKVGRILALEFDAQDRVIISDSDERTFRAFWNINVYAEEIHSAVKHLKENNCDIWSEPYEYDVGGGVGAWMEAVILAPDNVTLVLIELPTEGGGDMSADVGKDTAAKSKTKYGFSQIATTSHSVSSFDKAHAFYSAVLGMDTIVEQIMDDPRLNKLNSRPDDGRTRWAFMKGDDSLGKVVISHPMNYEVRNRTDVAVAPNIGYLAQGFSVSDINKVTPACAAVDAEIYSPLCAVDIPGVGPAKAIIARNPGSGGLTFIYSETS